MGLTVVDRRRDLTVDAWRGASVLVVILCHLVTGRYESRFEAAAAGNSIGLQGLAALIPSIARAIYVLSTDAGTLAVQFFLVISGYVITMLLVREHQESGRISLSAFYTRRAFRILPPAGLLIGFIGLMSSLGYITVAARSFRLAATFTCNLHTGCGWFLGHLWSLGVEEQFYLVWPCLLLLVGFRSIPRLAGLLLIGFLLLAQWHVLNVGHVDNAMCFACIAAGCLYATSGRLRAVIDRLGSPALLVAASALLLFRPLLLPVFRGSARVEEFLTPLLICCVMFGCFRHRERLEKLVLVQMLARLGLISYGLYLWQELFLGAPEQYLRASILNEPWWCPLIVVLSWFAVEKPLIRCGARLSRILQSRRLPAAPQAPAAPALHVQAE